MADDYPDGTSSDSQNAAAPSDPYARIRALYDAVTGGKYTPTDQDLRQFGDPSTFDTRYLNRINDAINNWWKTYQEQQPKPPTPPQPPPPGPTGGGGGGGSVSAGLPSPFTSPFIAPSNVNLGGPTGIEYIPPVPQFTPPPAF